MAKQRVTFTPDTITLHAGGFLRKGEPTILSPQDILSLTIESCSERLIFKTVQSQRVVIRAKKLRYPAVFFMHRDDPHFDDYKWGIRKFAKTHRLELRDRVKL